MLGASDAGWGNPLLLHPRRAGADTDLRPLATWLGACTPALHSFSRSLPSFPLALAITRASLVSF